MSHCVLFIYQHCWILRSGDEPKCHGQEALLISLSPHTRVDVQENLVLKVKLVDSQFSNRSAVFIIQS